MMLSILTIPDTVMSPEVLEINYIFIKIKYLQLLTGYTDDDESEKKTRLNKSFLFCANIANKRM
jgi:hypothetical protein